MLGESKCAPFDEPKSKGCATRRSFILDNESTYVYPGDGRNVSLRLSSFRQKRSVWQGSQYASAAAVIGGPQFLMWRARNNK